jgi:hypothetical protein
MKKIFILSALLALSACVTTGPEPVVTQADRDALFPLLNFREQCIAVVRNQPLQSVDPAKDCECVHRAQADILPPWIVRRTVDWQSGVNRSPYTAAEQARMERDVPASTIAAYRSCGVIP